MARYPKEFLERLREALPVSEVVGRRVELRKKGREWEACCPFHQEKTPSFTVNDAKGFYHCFGCAAHGDALGFLINYEKLPYPEAVETLARESGMAVPALSPEMARQDEQRQDLQDVMGNAASFYQQQLQLAGGSTARDYLAQRGITAEMIVQFGIGFAPDHRQALKSQLIQDGATERQLLAGGLVIQPDSGASYDRFRGRIMFPIRDNGGRVIAFGGRTLKKDDKAKYLNSPETELFHKGHVLYNWKQARAELSDQTPMLVAEGYMDVIALHQFGFPQAVAPLGTALTEAHLKKLWQACDAPILCLDGDAAGQRAMWRSAELALPFLEPGKTLKFCALPSGQDPDDFLQKEGASAFRKLLDHARPLSQVMLNHCRRETGEDTPEQRAALEARLDTLAGLIENTSLQQHFRRYFREQLWQKNRRKIPITHARVTQLAATSNTDDGHIALHSQMLKTLLTQPELLAQPAIEQALMELPITAISHQIICQWLLEQAGDLPSEQAIWPEEARALHADISITAGQWPQLMEAHTLLHMRHDLSLLKQEMVAQGWDEQRQHQITSLTTQIQEIEQRMFSG